MKWETNNYLEIEIGIIAGIILLTYTLKETSDLYSYIAAAVILSIFLIRKEKRNEKKNKKIHRSLKSLHNKVDKLTKKK